MRPNCFLYALWAVLPAVVDAENLMVSDVSVLTQANFTEFITSNDLVLTEFYAPWCQYCQALIPDYEEAATALKRKNKGIRLAKVDCTTEEDLCKEYGVGGYPDLQVLRGPENRTPYTGTRDVDGIVAFMMRQSLPVVSSLTMNNITNFKSTDDYVLIAHIAIEDTASKAVFEEAAEDLRHRILCGIIYGSDGSSPLPSLVLHKNKRHDDREENQEKLTQQPFETDTIKNFALRATIPLIGEINSDTIGLYKESKLPVGWIFGETPEERSRLGDILRPVAGSQRGKIHFASIDAAEYGASAKDLNLESGKFPAFAILDFATNKKFPFVVDPNKDKTPKEITTDAISEFVQDFLDGKIEPSITSDPIPEKQDGFVTVVVGHSYQDVVVNNDKDVLIKIYAPWCGHSKRFAPKYDLLGAEYAASNFTDKVTVAKIDGTTNDVPDGIPKGYPMLMLYPAGSKDAPILYKGNRSLEDIVMFISEKGKYGASIDIREKARALEEEAVTDAASASPSSEKSGQTHDEL